MFACSLGSITLSIQDVIIELTTIQAFTCAGLPSFFISSFVMVPSMKATLFFVVKAVIPAFSHTSKYFPLKHLVVIIAPGAPDG